MPIALAATSGYVRQDYVLLGTQPPAVNCTIAAPADSVLVHVGHACSYYAGTGYSPPTNTGTALTWRFAGYSVRSNSADPNDGFITAVFWAYNANAQTITVSSSQNNSLGAAYDFGHHAQVWAFTGANYSVRNVTNRASTGTTRTLTFAAQGSYLVGETIQVEIGNANYDGTFQITSVSGSSPWTVSYTAAGSLSEGTTSASGTVTEWPIPLGQAAGVGPYFSPSNGWDEPLYQPFLAAGSTVFACGLSLSATAPTAASGYTMYTPAAASGGGAPAWRGYASLRADQGPAAQFYINQTVTNPNTRIGFIVHPAPGPTLQTLTVSGIPDTDAFGTTTVTVVGTSQTVTATGIADTDAFGTASVNLRLSPAGIADTDAFGTSQVNLVLSLTGIDDTDEFGTSQVNLLLSPAGISDTDAFGTATVTVGGASQTVTVPSIVDSDDFGAAQINLNIVLSGIDDADDFGTSSINLSIGSTSITSTNAFGSHSVNLSILLDGIASGNLFGLPSVLSNTIITLEGIASTNTFGAHSVSTRQLVALSGIASTNAFGFHYISRGEDIPVDYPVTREDYIYDAVIYTGPVSN